MKLFISSSSAETKKFAEKLVKKISRSKKRYPHALVLALEGELGSGKTTFVQGFFRGLGIRRRVASPTFILMRRLALPRLKGKDLRFKNAFHIDAYRIRKPQEFLGLGVKKVLEDPENIVLIEWAENARRILPRNAIRVRFSHAREPRTRVIRLLS